MSMVLVLPTNNLPYCGNYSDTRFSSRRYKDGVADVERLPSRCGGHLLALAVRLRDVFGRVLQIKAIKKPRLVVLNVQFVILKPIHKTLREVLGTRRTRP